MTENKKSRRYAPEVRDRAVPMVLEHQPAPGLTANPSVFGDPRHQDNPRWRR